MTRRHEWPELLVAYVAARRRTAFEWGVHDCCRFAAGAVVEITGEDPMAAYVYTTEAEAVALIAAAGGLEVLVTQALGAPLPSLAQARRGDVLLADLDHGPTVGVCLGNTGVFAAARGVLHIPVERARVAWAVR